MYDEEEAAARDAGFWGVAATDPAFLRLAATGDPLIFVVTEEHEIVIAPQLGGPRPVSHAVLARGAPVLAAGELSLAVANEIKIVVELTNKSGHYRPGPECLEVAAEELRDLGFDVQEEVIVVHIER